MSKKETKWLVTVAGFDRYYNPPLETITVQITLKNNKTPVDWFIKRPTVFSRFEFIPQTLINFWKIN